MNEDHPLKKKILALPRVALLSAVEGDGWEDIAHMLAAHYCYWCGLDFLAETPGKDGLAIGPVRREVSAKCPSCGASI